MTIAIDTGSIVTRNDLYEVDESDQPVIDLSGMPGGLVVVSVLTEGTLFAYCSSVTDSGALSWTERGYDNWAVGEFPAIQCTIQTFWVWNPTPESGWSLTLNFLGTMKAASVMAFCVTGFEGDPAQPWYRESSPPYQYNDTDDTGSQPFRTSQTIDTAITDAVVLSFYGNKDVAQVAVADTADGYTEIGTGVATPIVGGGYDWGARQQVQYKHITGGPFSNQIAHWVGESAGADDDFTGWGVITDVINNTIPEVVIPGTLLPAVTVLTFL